MESRTTGVPAASESHAFYQRLQALLSQLIELIQFTLIAAGVSVLCSICWAAMKSKSAFLSSKVVQLLDIILEIGFQSGGDYEPNGDFVRKQIAPNLCIFSVPVKKTIEGIVQEIAMTVFVEKLGEVERIWFINPVPVPASVIESFLRPNRSYVIVLPMKAHHLHVDPFLELLPQESVQVIGSPMAGLRHTPQLSVSLPHSIESSQVEMHMLCHEMEEFAITIRAEGGHNIAVFVHYVACGKNFQFYYPGRLKWLERTVGYFSSWQDSGCTTLFVQPFAYKLRGNQELVTSMLQRDWHAVISVHGGHCSGEPKAIMKRAFGWLEERQASSEPRFVEVREPIPNIANRELA